MNIELGKSFDMFIFNKTVNIVSRTPICPGRKDRCSFTRNEEFILSVNPPLQYQGDNTAAQYDGETSNTCSRLESVKSITPPCASLPKLLQWLDERPVADSTGNFSTSYVSKVVEPHTSSHWTHTFLVHPFCTHSFKKRKTFSCYMQNNRKWPTDRKTNVPLTSTEVLRALHCSYQVLKKWFRLGNQ